MDPHLFDAMARRLARTRSRRSLTGGTLSATMLAAAGWGDVLQAKQPETEACLPPGERCGTKKKDAPCRKCCQRHFITAPNGKKKCACRPNGTGCSNSSQCCSGTCENSVCVTAPCRTPGVACDIDSQCCAGACGDGVCQARGCTSAGGGCTDNADCCSNVCGESVTLGTFCRDANCVSDGGSCSVATQCCSGRCSFGGCIAILAE